MSCLCPEDKNLFPNSKISHIVASNEKYLFVVDDTDTEVHPPQKALLSNWEYMPGVIQAQSRNVTIADKAFFFYSIQTSVFAKCRVCMLFNLVATKDVSLIVNAATCVLASLGV